ncbi:hypothetical protein D3C76_1679370 [compost metagenome]
MADRHSDHHRLGGLRHRVLWHADEAQHQTHLRRQLVLRRLHPDRGAAAHRQQPGAAGQPDQILFGLRRRHRCHGAVVVRP